MNSALIVVSAKAVPTWAAPANIADAARPSSKFILVFIVTSLLLLLKPNAVILVLPRRPSAVDQKDGSVDQRCRRRGQEHDRARDFDRLPDPAERDIGDSLLQKSRIRERRRGAVGADEGRRHRI